MSSSDVLIVFFFVLLSFMVRINSAAITPVSKETKIKKPTSKDTILPNDEHIYFGFYDDNDGASVKDAGANVILTDSVSAIYDFTFANNPAAAVIFFKTENTFLKHVGPGKLRVPNPTWKSEWEKLRVKLDPFAKNGTVAGFFLGDELLCSCVSLAFIEVMAKTVREAFPGVNVWYNEGSGQVVKPSQCTNVTKFYIPKDVSLFSTDIYHYAAEPGWVERKVKLFYETYIFPLLDQSSQRAAFVPGSFSSTTGGPKDAPCNASCYREMIIQDAEEYFKWAREDERVGGIFPWHWSSCRTNPDCVKHWDEVGTAELPQLAAKWKELANGGKKH
jgi:hypothetical protein